MPRAPLLLALASLSALLAGCSHEGGGIPPEPTEPTDPTDAPDRPRLTFSGVVRDALTGEPLPDATVRLDLAQTRPCRREGIVWNAYDLAVDATGAFGPLRLPTPQSDDVAFFLHAQAPGHAPNVTFIGPTEARLGTRNMTVLLHPDVAFEGKAPPGTLVALEAPGFPRVTLADAEGRFAFPQARAVEASFVAGTEPPVLGRITPPRTLDLSLAGNGTTWRLEGVVKAPSGAPVEADVVAWNGSQLAGVGRSGPNGVFAIPLAPTGQDLLLEARTPDNALGGSLRVLVEGPPALRQSLLMRALC